MSRIAGLLFTSIMIMAFVSCAGLPHWFNAAVGGQGGGTSSSLNPLETGGIYVSTNGVDLNNIGTNPAQPLATLNQALKQAGMYAQSNIFIAEGVYSVSNVIAGDFSNGVVVYGWTNLLISGGWLSDFSERSAIGTAIDAGNMKRHVIRVENCVFITLDSLTLMNGYNPDTAILTEDKGGGILVRGTRDSRFTNIYLLSNTAPYGGGIGIEYDCSNITVHIQDSASNRALLGGGCVYMAGNNIHISGSIKENRSDQNGGGVFMTGHYNSVTADVQYNRAGQNGGGVFADNLSEHCVLDLNALYNTATNSVGGVGGAVACNGKSNTVRGTYQYNLAFLYGGGIFLDSGASYAAVDVTAQYNAATNMANSSGGGLYSQGTYHVILGNYNNNAASYQGGGVCQQGSYISNEINAGYNTASHGAGMYLGGQNNMALGSYNGNTGFEYGGGMYITGDNHVVLGANISDNQSSHSNALYSAVCLLFAQNITMEFCNFERNIIYFSTNIKIAAVGLTGESPVNIIGCNFNENRDLYNSMDIFLSNTVTNMPLQIVSNTFRALEGFTNKIYISEGLVFDIYGVSYQLWHNFFATNYTNTSGLVSYKDYINVISNPVPVYSSNTGAYGNGGNDTNYYFY